MPTKEGEMVKETHGKDAYSSTARQAAETAKDDAVGTATIVAGLSIRRGKPFPEQLRCRKQLGSPAQTPLEPGFFLYTRPRRGTPAVDQRLVRRRGVPSLPSKGQTGRAGE